jgi:hypothetical protein
MRVLGLAALVAASASCGDVIRQGRSPVMLVINQLSAAPGNRPSVLTGTLFSDVITNITTPAPCAPDNPCPTVFNDVGSAQLSIALKDTTVTPTSNNNVTIYRYRVEYTRADGRNTPGVDVPFPFDGAVTGTVTPGGTLTLGFELVRHAAKQESPLVQLISNPGIITTVTRITFYGRDQVGNDVTVTGTLTIDFGNFGDVA